MALNAAQRSAAEHDGDEPLLVIAGAGSGKTNTLAHRVAHLVLSGCDPRRLLLLTFTRRAAVEMTRRARAIVAEVSRASGRRLAADLRWSGTFHAVANRLLRLHADTVGLDPSFTVLDRGDAAGLLDLLRNELGLARRGERGRGRFPRKDTCLSIYSRTVNAQCAVEQVLADAYPWCEEHADALRSLFRAYVDAKQARRVLDYDDLLLYWYHLVGEPHAARVIGERFDHVLVDEYQDTCAVQAAILQRLKPDGRGLTVVGDDAQAIYSFRAASVQNILDFPRQFPVAARVVTLEENYRSTQPILDAANAVIAEARDLYPKELVARKASSERPVLVTVEDELAQVEYVVERILDTREAGVDLKRQAVLMRAAHHSDALEVELGRRNIPFVKYGGLKFLEAAHVKDLLCVLRWAENPADEIAGFRVLQLLPGVGPATARRGLDAGAGGAGELRRLGPPGAAAETWAELCDLLEELRGVGSPWRGQVGRARVFYEPLLAELYDNAHARVGDLEQLEAIAGEYETRERFLSELTLDPPESSGDLAGDPLLDEDYLVLSTIHSAKGQEWDAVYVLNVADGCIPSDMATGKPEQVEEERRLLYVAMTRARTQLHLVHPLRMYIRQQRRYGDRHVYTPVSRFLSESVQAHVERVAQAGAPLARAGDRGAGVTPGATIDVASRLRDMW